MTRPDIVLATVECARWDYRSTLSPNADLTAHEGIAAAHYTRPSLAAVHAPTWDSVLDTRVRGPTIADTFSDAGYRTAAVAYSPQTTAAFGFDRGFDDARLCEPDGGRLGRGSRLREKLASVGPIRWVHNHLHGKHAVFDGIPRDASVVEHARDAFRGDEPLFLWVHFMGSHRPYGWGDDAIDAEVSRRLATASPDGGHDELAAQAEAAYTEALGRVRGHLQALLDAAPNDAVVWICGDHGEELGEDGYFLHAGYRQRVVDSLVKVPVFTRNLALDGPVSLMDAGAYLTAAADVTEPDAWAARRGRESFLTVAPWDGTATLRVQTPGSGVDLRFRAADLPETSGSDVGRDVKAQLESLGYRGVG